MNRDDRSRSRERTFDDNKNKKLFVTGIPADTTQDELGKLFCKHGDVVDVYIKTRPDNSAFAFVEMADLEQATTAKSELDRCEFKGQSIRVNYSKPRVPNGGGGGDRGGGDRGGDRSNSRDRDSFGGGGGKRGGFGGDRGGGDRGGRGGGRGCFNCGEEGHFSRECPKPRGGGGGGSGGGRGGGFGDRGPRGGYNSGGNSGGGGGFGSRGGYEGRSSGPAVETKKSAPLEDMDY